MISISTLDATACLVAATSKSAAPADDDTAAACLSLACYLPFSSKQLP